MKTWSIAGTAAGLVVVAAVALAEPSQGPPGAVRPEPWQNQHRGQMLQKALADPEFAAELGLTDEETAALRQSMWETRKTSIQLKAEREIAELELEKLLAGDAPEEAAIMKAVAEVGRLQTELRKTHVKQQLNVRGILGAEKMNAVRRHLRHKMQRRHGPPRGDWERAGPRGRAPGKGGPGSGPPWDAVRGEPGRER